MCGVLPKRPGSVYCRRSKTCIWERLQWRGGDSMGIRFTGSQGQYERIRRRNSSQQESNQLERESPEPLDGAERKHTRWNRFAVWLQDWSREVWSGAKIIVQWAVGLLAVGFIVALMVNGYQDLDNSGWITHDHDTPVWIQGEWLVGEYRDCQMRTKTVAGGDKALDNLDKLPRLFCGKDANGLFDFQRTNGAVPPPPDRVPPKGAMYLYTVTADELEQDFHVMPVRYSGRIDRTDKWVISWRCQRLSASLECNALN